MIEYTLKTEARVGGYFIARPRDPAPLDTLLEQAQRKTGGYITWRGRLPFRPRSTGWKSQNHHLRGHARQLCDHTGFSMSEMMQLIKEDTPSWPVGFKEFRGKRRAVYASEADISMEVAHDAIERTHVMAAELGIKLIEEDE